MTTRQLVSAIVVPAVLGLALAACTRGDVPDRPRADRQLEVTYRTVVVEFDQHPPDRARLARAAAAFLDTGRGRLDVVAPEWQAQELADRLAAAGVPANRINVRAEPDRGPWLVFRGRRAVLPDCRTGQSAERDEAARALRQLFRDDANVPSSRFGCANRRNLGAMVADPDDLRRPATPGAASDRTTTDAIRRSREDAGNPGFDTGGGATGGQ